ncbi:hypothetical protein WN944_015792 [Citrus x changshan-huyou]|uniref:Uncharacterized protein n=1 Tax=Citrus x changshan-huyou TaxID=2935761 RepID=A0AAP0M9N4_9ROSI
MEEDKITIASITTEKTEKVRIADGEKLEPQRGCCIYRVPKGLRKINKETYTPKVISIGPLHHPHHHKNELADMEKQKIRYQTEFSKRITDETWQELIHFVDLYEQSIRNCYEDTPCTFKLKKFDFITMILYDAELYRLAFPNPEIRYPSFFDLSCNFFFPNKQLIEIGVGIEEVKHFTDLRRHFMTTKLYQLQEPEESGGFVTDLPCAVKLKESGAKFKCKEGERPLDVSFKEIKRLCLRVPELQIPKIEVYDETELLFRNIMALEQCHYPYETHVCNFMDLVEIGRLYNQLEQSLPRSPFQNYKMN